MKSANLAGALVTLCSLIWPTLALAEQPDAMAPDALEEITVTAQKQSQALQRTAAAITVIDGADLVASGLTTLRDAQMFVPGARFQAEGNNTQVFIRGVGAGLDQNNIEPSVAFNFDGVYIPREGTSAALFDVAQIEVLPGPQGTLYGRSAIGGTVNVEFVRPGFDSRGVALIELGNDSLLHATAARNFVASEQLALRVAADYQYNDGYNASGADARNDTAVRVSALYRRSDEVTAYLWAFGATKNGHPANLVNKGFDPSTGGYREEAFLHPDPWNDTRTDSLAALAPFGSAVADEQRYETLAVGGRLDWQIQGLTLSYLPGYFYLDSAPDYWLGTIRANLSAHYNQISQELRIASDDAGRLTWLAGVHAYEVRNGGALVLFTNQPFAFRQSNIEFNQLGGQAVFGQATVKATPTFRVTLGGRYSTTERIGRGLTSDQLGALPYTFERRFNRFDWKAGVEYDLRQQVMTYATIQTGFTPGTYNELPAAPQADNLVKPAKLLAYAAGAKSRWREGTLQVNAELFLYDYEDLFIQNYDVSAAYNPVFNAKRVEIHGAQVNVLHRLTGSATANLDIGYTHARNRDFTTPNGISYNGLQLAYAPDWTIAAGYGQDFRMGHGTVRARLDARYESAWYADFLQNPGVRQKPSAKGDLSLTYLAPNDWSVGVWVRNVSNEAVLAATAAAGIPGPATAYLEAPRTYGLRVTANF